jgi:hypothetical protein
MVKSLKIMPVLLLLPALIVFSGCTKSAAETPITTPATTPPVSAIQVVKDVTAAEANDLILLNSNNPDFKIIDVRTADEYATGHLVNAINIDYYLENFKTEIGKLDRRGTGYYEKPGFYECL